MFSHGARAGQVATLDEAGYGEVAATSNTEAMKAFILRVVESRGGVVMNYGDLSGFAPYYSGEKSVQSFPRLVEELGTCHWVQLPAPAMGPDTRPIAGHGHQNDGSGALWCAVANTEHGRIPGKAKGGECWYSFGGEERTARDFEVIHAEEFYRSSPQGPAHGHQSNGAGALWCAVANTEHGRIPGKAREGECWYPYGGVEHTTRDFMYVGVGGNGEEMTGHGHQYDGTGYLWCAVANTEHGRIPGKAKGDTCWYPYGGEERTTRDFRVIHAEGYYSSPQGAAHGHQNDGSGELWCAVANTEHGKIPGKARGGECWYPYGGGEHTTVDFKYVA